MPAITGIGCLHFCITFFGHEQIVYLVHVFVHIDMNQSYRYFKNNNIQS